MTDVDPKAASPTRAPRWRRWLVELLMLAAVLVGVNVWQTRHLVPRGARAPALALLDLDGALHQLSELRGKRVLLHFWATWCGVCALEHGALNAVQDALGPDEVLLTVVANGGDPQKVRDYVAEHGLRYPVLLGTRAALAAFHVDRFPTSYYVDPEGRMASSDAGFSTQWGMRLRLGCAGGG